MVSVYILGSNPRSMSSKHPKQQTSAKVDLLFAAKHSKGVHPRPASTAPTDQIMKRSMYRKTVHGETSGRVEKVNQNTHLLAWICR